MPQKTRRIVLAALFGLAMAFGIGSACGVAHSVAGTSAQQIAADPGGEFGGEGG